MNQLSVQLVASLVGRAKGTALNPKLINTLNGRTFNAALGLTGTSGATFADNGVDVSATLATTASTVYDLANFTNALGEPTQALSICRLFYVKHDLASPASSITVGDSGANGFKPLGALGTTAAVMAPGAILIIPVPTAVGVTVNTTAKDVKVLNNGTTVAVYQIGWWGES